MSAPLEITRTDYTSAELRARSGRCSDGAQVRRLLALALVLDGHSRTEAAALSGMDRQTLRDWVHRFAIIPAMFVVALPALGALNIMHLHSPRSAILSAVIFNALVIVALIPLALKGAKYRAVGAGKLLSRNLLIYGLGGLVAPFVGIKLIDLIVSALGLA